jgi:hypothetical protein
MDHKRVTTSCWRVSYLNFLCAFFLHAEGMHMRTIRLIQR